MFTLVPKATPEKTNPITRKPEISASGKAARYFVNLQRSRKQFWEKYRHLLLPIIRTQIQNSGRTGRIRKAAMEKKLRPTKKFQNLESLKLSVANNHEPNNDPFVGEKINSLKNAKRRFLYPWIILSKCI